MLRRASEELARPTINAVMRNRKKVEGYMKIKDVRPHPYVKILRCDLCNREAEDGDSEFYEFTSIEYKAGYGSVFGDENMVEIDMCQPCLKEALNPWLRVTEPKAESQ